MGNEIALYQNREPVTAEQGPSIFNSEDFGNVRAFLRDGEPWFVASDVARALGYNNPSEAVRDNCKYVELLKTSLGLGWNIPPRGILIIPESDAYALVFRSSLPKAEEFRRWLCEEVIPAIRKTGSYSMHPALPKSYAEALRELADTVEKKEAAEQALALEQEAHALTKDHLEKTEELRAKAVREKSWIGERREATAMATASAERRRANKLGEENESLREQIGDSTNWKTVKAQIGELKKYFNLATKGA